MVEIRFLRLPAIGVMLVVCALIVTKADTAVRAQSAWPAEAKIAFAAKSGDSYDIFLATADGAEPTRLTTQQTHERFPVWSPDRTQLAFGVERDGKWERWVVDADGKHPRMLTRDVVAKTPRSWSPETGRESSSRRCATATPRSTRRAPITAAQRG